MRGRKLPSLQTEPQKIQPDSFLRICPATKCDNRNIELLAEHNPRGVSASDLLDRAVSWNRPTPRC
jgi:hypothetical protein